MREIQSMQLTVEMEQAKAWLFGNQPEYFSKLAGMNPERRFTLARKFHLQGERDGALLFAIDAEMQTFEEQDGQMTQSFTDVPAVVTVRIEPSGEGRTEVRASVSEGTPVEDQLIEWAEGLLESFRQAFEETPEEEAE
jgi:hypothetical protein